MENELLKIINEETKGLVKVNYFPSYETVTGKYGFELKDIKMLKNINGDDATVQIFFRERSKVVRVMVEVETQSEGTLTYTTTYASPELEDLFTKQNNS
ncbi:MAG: hypothetical protein RBR95_08815 [Ignavibacteriaceae bacterium]|jgi:hypothetical protein|nr:hypothetical protein [Ignavibacteriaceae bacterium]